MVPNFIGGNRLVDLCGRNFGTISGPTWTSSIRPKNINTLFFNGTSDYVNIGQPSNLKFGSGDFSYVAWIKTSSTGTFKIIFGESNNNTAERYIFKNNTNKLAFFVRDISGNSISIASTASISDNKWHHIVGTRIGINAYLYLDGILVANNSNGILANTDTSPAANIQIGQRDAVGSNLNWSGNIDDVLAYNRGLSSSEVLQLYNYTSSLYDPTLNYMGNFPQFGRGLIIDNGGYFINSIPNLGYFNTGLISTPHG